MRFIVFTLPILTFGCLTLPALAAEQVPLAKPEILQEPALGALAPDDERLESLYSKLKKERSPASARALAEEIRETSSLSGSATVDMLMQNTTKALTEKRYGAALDFLDQVTLLAPSFAEGYNRRATVHFVMGNYPKSLSDIARTLKLDPRNLGALSGFAGILEETGRDQQALSAWEAYLGIYPADPEAQKKAIDLIDKLAGQKT